MPRALTPTLLCVGLSLALTPALCPRSAQAQAAPAADTPAVTIVREFLADRAAGRYAAAYALLSDGSHRDYTAAQFTAGRPLPPATPRQMSDPLFGLAVLLADTHDTRKYAFTVLGPDPADPKAVLVRAAPPATARGVSAVTIHLLTVRGPGHAPRVDILQSLRRAAPTVFAGVRGNAKLAISRNNLKELSLGILQYEQDHDEMTPDADKWVDEIMPYVRSKAPFHDPSAPAGQAYSYAYNRALSHKSLAQFDSPATTIMLFESAKGVKNASDTGQSVPRPGRHQGGTDYAFADGHVKWFKDGTKLSYKLTGK